MSTLIRTQEQYQSLLAQQKQLWGRMQHNAYFLPDFLNEPIREERLSYELFPDLLLFFLRQEDCVQLYYYAPATLSESAHKLEADHDLPLISSLMGVVPAEKIIVSHESLRFPDELLPDRLSGAEQLLCSLGMKRFDCYYHMIAKPMKKIDVSAEGYTVRDALPKHKSAILSLLHQTFPAATSELPSRESLAGHIRAGESFVVLDPENMVCGYVQLEKQGSQYFLRHLVVAPSYRGHKLSRLLCSYLAEQMGDASCVLWVREDNFPARQLYDHYGFHFDGKILLNYLLPPQE